MKTEKNNIFTKYKELFKEAFEDLKTKGRRYKQIPNILTTLRLTAPFFIIPAALMGNVPLVIGLTIGFGLTDLVDGFIARKWNLTSELGKDLDAVCDKVFASTLLLTASISNPILLLNLGLEAVIAGINSYKTIKGEEVSSTKIGKLKTWSLFTLLGVGLIAPYMSSNIPLNLLVATTTYMQGLTIGSYLITNDKKEEPVEIPVEEYKEKKIAYDENAETKEFVKVKDKDIDKKQELENFKEAIIQEQQPIKEEEPKQLKKRL